MDKISSQGFRFREPPDDLTLTWLYSYDKPNGHQRNGEGRPQRHLVRIDRKQPQDRSGAWLRFAGLALALLALAAAVVSYQAQFALVFAYKAERVVAAIQAAIPDSGSLVFACLGIALALQGKRALRARTLNVLCVGISIAMNALRATPGWSALSVWIMAPTLYALASDTLIGVLRAYAIARQKRFNEALADEGVTPLQVVGQVALYLLRFAMAPVSTPVGLRRWLLLKTPLPEKPPVRVITVSPPRKPKASGGGRRPRDGTKTARMIALAGAGRDLKTIPLNEVSALATRISGEIGLDGGAARAALLKHVRRLQGIQEGSKS